MYVTFIYLHNTIKQAKLKGIKEVGLAIILILILIEIPSTARHKTNLPGFYISSYYSAAFLKFFSVQSLLLQKHFSLYFLKTFTF